MRLSRTKIYDMRRIEKGNLSTADLLERSGYMKQIQSGLYVQMNLMKRLINKWVEFKFGNGDYFMNTYQKWVELK